MSKSPRLFLLLASRLPTQRGLTLIEILVSSIVGVMVLGVALSFTVSNRNLFERDTDRIQVNQNLTAAIEIMGNDIRQAGERIAQGDFPAVEMTATELILRRRPVSEELQLCQDVTGSAAEVVVTQNPVITSGCSATAAAVANWVAESVNFPGYLYIPAQRRGVFFISGAGSDATRVATAGLTGNFTEAARLPMYLLEERRYSLGDDGVLRLTIRELAEPQVFEIANRITDFEVNVFLVGDLTPITLFGADPAHQWADIRTVEVTLTAETDVGFGRTEPRSITSRFFPRNAASRD